MQKKGNRTFSPISDRHPTEWKTGMPNLGLTCYFGSSIQLFLHCISLKKLNKKFQSAFLSELQSLTNPSKKQQLGKLLFSLYSKLQFSNKGTCKFNDPMRVISAMIQHSIMEKVKYNVQEMPNRLTDDYKYWTLEDSELSFHFRSVIYEGFWCDKCKTSELINEENKFVFNISKNQLKNNSIQQSLDEQIQKSNGNTQMKCKSCFMSMKKINGLLKMPTFLYINLDSNLIQKIDLEKQISLYDEAFDRNVDYSLKGFICHPPSHYTYWKKESENEWTCFDDDKVKTYDSPIFGLQYAKGLLYVINGQKEYDSTQFQSTDSRVNQALASFLIDYDITFISKEDEINNILLIKADDKNKNPLEIKAIKMKTPNESKFFFELQAKINKVQFGIAQCQLIKEKSNDYSLFLVRSFKNYSKLEDRFEHFPEQTRFQIFLQIITILKHLEENQLVCYCIQLKDILIDQQNKINISGFNLYPNSQQMSSFSISDNLYQLRILLTQLFPEQNKVFNDLLNVLKVDPKIENIFEQISQQLEDNQTQSSKVQSNDSIKQQESNKTIEKKKGQSQSYHQTPETKSRDFSYQEYQQLLKEISSKISFEDIMESIAYLKSMKHQFISVQNIAQYGAIIKTQFHGKNFLIKVFRYKLSQEQVNYESQANLLQSIQQSYCQIVKLMNIPKRNIILVINQENTGKMLESFLNDQTNFSTFQRLKILRSILAFMEESNKKGVIIGNLSAPGVVIIKDEETILCNVGLFDLNCSFSYSMAYCLNEFEKFKDQKQRDDLINLHQIITLLCNEESKDVFNQIEKIIKLNRLNSLPLDVIKKIQIFVSEKINKSSNVKQFSQTCKSIHTPSIGSKGIQIKIATQDSLPQTVSIQPSDKIQILRSMIDVNYEYLLLDQNSNYLQDDLTFQQYCIQDQSVFIVFMISNKLIRLNIYYIMKKQSDFTLLCSVKANDSLAVKHIKDYIEREHKIPSQQQHLFLKSKEELQDRRPIVTYTQMTQCDIFLLY